MKGKKKIIMVLFNKQTLEILGGKQGETERDGKQIKIMLEGAGYWNVPDKKEWESVFNHLMLEYNAAIYVARRLKEIGREKNDKELANIDVREAVTASLLSDIGKRRAKEEEILGRADKDRHGIIGRKMLEKAGFSENVFRAAESHDFPTSKDELVNIYDKIALFTDLVASQEYMTPTQRLADIKARWITQRKAQGKESRIAEDNFNAYEKVVQETTDEIFNLLDDTSEEFVKKIKKEVEEAREVRYLRALYRRNLEKRGIEFADRLDKIREAKQEKL